MRPTESSDPGVVHAVLNSFYGYQGWDQQLLSALIAPLSDRMEWYWWNNAGAGGPVPPFVPGWEDDPWPYTYDEWKGILTETFAPDPFAEEREVERAEREAVAV